MAELDDFDEEAGMQIANEWAILQVTQAKPPTARELYYALKTEAAK